MIKILVRVIFFYLFISCVYAQDKDLQSWHNLEFGYNPVSDLSLTVNNGIRFVDDVSDVSRCFFDINIKRKHSNLLSYSVGYRYLFDFNTSDNVDNIRGYGMMGGIDIKMDKKPGAAGFTCFKHCYEAGVNFKATGDCLIIAPMFICEKKHIDEIIEKLRTGITNYAKSKKN